MQPRRLKPSPNPNPPHNSPPREIAVGFPGVSSQADTESHSTPTATKHAIIELNSTTSRLAGDIVGVRVNDMMRSVILVDVAGGISPVGLMFSSKEEATTAYVRILAEWKAALSAA